MDGDRLARSIGGRWDGEIVPQLVDYIRIPNKSPHFDPDWAAHGHMDRAVAMFEAWARDRLPALPGATVEVVRLAGRTPVILIEVPGSGGAPGGPTVLLYGHLDKQPEMVGWAEGTGPWIPVQRDGRLYGRGGADDGYAMFGSLAALLALAEQGLPYPPCSILIEASEESGSCDLPPYIEHLAPRLGRPALVVCLDSGCADYERLWVTTSLRGMAGGTLTVRVLTEGVHSGDASGVVPSSFRLFRQLLSRLEDEATGAILPPELQVQVPAERIAQARRTAAALGDRLYSRFPFAGGTRPMSDDPVDLVLNRTWRPQLAVTGMAGLPEPGNAGNVLLPETRAKLSLRLPPTLDAEAAGALVERLLTGNAPEGAEVIFTPGDTATGWNAPALAPWLERSLERAGTAAFGQAPGYMGEGGSIPFMAMLGARFPDAQFLITGVLGPHSNAHGPNEFLDIATGKRVTEVVARVLADLAAA
ncbi:MAG: M20/M25/M40 family metallo-hydrolase [Dongiaceae bacterium]